MRYCGTTSEAHAGKDKHLFGGELLICLRVKWLHEASRDASGHLDAEATP